MDYTVKQFAGLAGVSVRTLHYYDQIGLLTPDRVASNGYRYYGETALLRLQQILFFKELGLDLATIGEILDQPGFDQLRTLQVHRQQMKEHAERLQRLISTIDRTILHLQGDKTMNAKDMFDGFSEEKQAQYQEEARKLYGHSPQYAESQQRWGSYSSERQEEIKAEGGAILEAFAAVVESGPASQEAQKLAADWHRHIGNFYTCSLEMLQGLGNLYVESPEFAANFRSVHPELPEFVRDALSIYVQSGEE
jgi:MerR family transcriptional regulator, thiopeptide resistance regulator